VISDALPFGRLWYDTLDNAIVYAMHSSRSHEAVIRVYDAAGNVIERLPARPRGFGGHLPGDTRAPGETPN